MHIIHAVLKKNRKSLKFCGVVPWYAYCPPCLTIKWRLQAYIVGPRILGISLQTQDFMGEFLKQNTFREKDLTFL